MKLKEQLEIIEEENNNIFDTERRIYYILNHIVYDDPEPRELFILGELLLELLAGIKTNAKGIDNVLSELLIN